MQSFAGANQKFIASHFFNINKPWMNPGTGKIDTYRIRDNDASSYCYFELDSHVPSRYIHRIASLGLYPVSNIHIPVIKQHRKLLEHTYTELNK